MTSIIPIMHCFDNNYVIPASVAFYSLLKNSDPQYLYDLYVLHTDITARNQAKLKRTIKAFKNARLEFIDMKDNFHDLWQMTKSKGHFSKEIFYKFIPASVFPNLDKIMIADVGVVYLNCVSKIFNGFDVINEDYYLAAFKGLVLKESCVHKSMISYAKNFNDEEISKLYTGAGYYIFNLKK